MTLRYKNETGMQIDSESKNDPEMKNVAEMHINDNEM